MHGSAAAVDEHVREGEKAESIYIYILVPTYKIVWPTYHKSVLALYCKGPILENP